ncbi:hypothetical protein OHS33_15415 [Streptomyces sp. NBC_00536]|uniref:hypothetical protein n=1 Tax=Streptomyces sp. NBC_00536 TaxID=2975769 RepID=UPI002E7FE7A0|nr:hypothetical protein [Streptomyces sp. NBC_00536]WUC79593.1 hypothetical protein OHS33_15415 [Streptomyces sp. NBC_00536]
MLAFVPYLCVTSITRVSMYLVHVHLRSPECGRLLPPEAEELVTASAADTDGFELAVVHPREQPHPVVGVYMQASSLAAAEEGAAAIWLAAAAAHPQLRPWELVRAEIPLLPLDVGW